MNKRGMTTIELITSFALATVIFMVLFNLVVSLKDIYVMSGNKTNMLIEQANLNKALNENINSSNRVQKIKIINENEYTITTNGGEKKLIIDSENKTISFDKYVLHIPSYVNIDSNNDKYIDWNNISEYIHIYNDRILVIEIPLVDKENNHYDIKAVYQYDDILEIEE